MEQAEVESIKDKKGKLIMSQYVPERGYYKNRNFYYY